MPDPANERVLDDRRYVVVHESTATYIASRGLRVIPAPTWAPIRRGGFILTAVPAADGFGASQVSWIVSRDGHRFLHGGDTLWHGTWDIIGEQYGPFDAAILLRARVLVPIRYGLNDPPYYVEVANPLETAREAAESRQVHVRHVLPGESFLVN